MSDNDQQKRLQTFKEGLEKLSEETQFTLVAKISPDGPIFQYADLKAAQESSEGGSSEEGDNNQ